ncbi:MAG: hypothetical protein OET44_02980 [Gammaproteobacteria bacterium]|nr:hypothetical protein [Gammaproteobacteria bacterium]
MNTGDMRLEREVMQLERELKMLKLTRYEDPAASDYYLRLKGLYARRRAILDAHRRRRERAPANRTVPV